MSRLGKQQHARRSSRIGWPLALGFLTLGGLLLNSGIDNGEAGGMIAGAILLTIGALILRALLAEVPRDSKMVCRKQTVYGITNQRAFVLKQCRTEFPMRSLDWRFTSMVRAEAVGSDGRGTVQFLSWDPVERRWVHALRFFMVHDARSVEAQAIAARDAAQA